MHLLARTIGQVSSRDEPIGRSRRGGRWLDAVGTDRKQWPIGSSRPTTARSRRSRHATELVRQPGRDPGEEVTLDLDATESVVFARRKHGTGRSQRGRPAHNSYVRPARERSAAAASWTPAWPWKDWWRTSCLLKSSEGRPSLRTASDSDPIALTEMTAPAGETVVEPTPAVSSIRLRASARAVTSKSRIDRESTGVAPLVCSERWVELTAETREQKSQSSRKSLPVLTSSDRLDLGVGLSHRRGYPQVAGHRGCRR